MYRYVIKIITEKPKTKNDHAFVILKLQEEMRRQDQDIAKQLLNIHYLIQGLKLEWSCQEHQLMLDDAKSELEEIKEIKRVSDLPLQNDQSLRELGLAKMNIAMRKYSVF